jgi:hypothetical protein
VEPLRIISALAFGHPPDDTLALAGEAMSRIWSNNGQMLWRFTQNVTPLPARNAGSYFNAMAVYTRRYQDVFTGGNAQATETVRLSVTANILPHDPAFSGFILDFTDSTHGVSAFEGIVVATCAYLMQLLRERRWLTDDQAPGFWQLNNRRWSSPLVANALNGGPHDLGAFMVILQNYGLFPTITEQSAYEAVWVRRLFVP